MGYLRLKHNSRLIFDPTYPDIDQTALPVYDWMEFYGVVEEAIPPDMPPPLGDKDIDLHMMVEIQSPYDGNTLDRPIVHLRGQYISNDHLFSTRIDLKKKCNSICYHAIRESVAMGKSLITLIKTDDNLSDFLTKMTSGAKRRKIVSEVVHDIYDDFSKQ
jgi:hypothetical protein